MDAFFGASPSSSPSLAAALLGAPPSSSPAGEDYENEYDAPLEASPSSSPAGEDYENEYDVFLTFHGPDTRSTVAGSIHSALVGGGFRVFDDEEEIHFGDNIEETRMGPLTNSKIYIPIFSSNFASNGCCIREIVRMVECKRKSSGKVILPVFYDVDVHDVKLETDLYPRFLERQNIKSGDKDGKKQWKKALIEVAGNEGLNFRDHGLDKLTKLMVEKVRGQLGTRSEWKVRNGSFRRKITSGQRGKLLGSSRKDNENEYDVFLCWRGRDTCLNIADPLSSVLVSAGFHIFWDDGELSRSNAEIQGKVMEAITNSKIYIPIFSSDYAKSKWCVQEIVHMVECKRKSSDKVILPILYDVDANLARHSLRLCGSFFMFFTVVALRRRHKWVKVLREIAGIRALNLRDYGIDKLIKLTVEAAQDRLGTRSRERVPNVTSDVYYVSPGGSFRRRMTSWKRGKLLGSGSFGTVYEGFADDGCFYAVKEVSLLDLGHRGKQRVSQLHREIKFLSEFEHENIVQYIGTYQDDEKLYIFLELVTKGSLAKLYQDHELRDSQVSAYTRQILNGLKYLHDQNIVHRDIKCANILVDASGYVKLADFGLAKATIFSDAKTSVGTAFWMAPEVVNRQNRSYGLAADIWSLGCTVLEMLTRQHPYPHLEWALYKIGMGEPPQVPDSLSRDARDFILICLQVNPNDRPIAVQLLDHPFVRYLSL